MYDYITYTPLSNNNHNFILVYFNYHFESNIHPHSTFKNLTDSLSTSISIISVVFLRTFPTHIAGHSLGILHIANNELCYEFANHFTDKIQRTCTSISSHLPISSLPCICISKPIPYYFSKFYMPSIFTIYNLISKSYSSHSSDPINLAVFKKLNYTLSPYILDIIIISLNYGIFPTSFKHAISSPILKKSLLDPNIIANYHPISQLPFLSKILERIVAIQFNRYIAENKLYDIYQNAFRRGHSTETALQQILNNIYSTVSSSISCQLILVYLSCAFDSLSHSDLISIL